MLDEQSRRVLAMVESWGDVSNLSPAEARQLDGRRRAELGGSADPVASVEDLEIDGPRGPLAVRVYRSSGETPGTLLWLHGGGWVVGSLDGIDDQARRLANASGCAVVAVDYGLAPEARFPKGMQDCLRALSWVHDNARLLGAPAGRVAVGGDSAGGNLAVALCLMARDRGEPPIDFQLLVYPVMCRDLHPGSGHAFAEGHWLTLDAMDWYWRHYLRSADDGADPLASPLLASSFEGLPPALVVLAECDLLRDEGRMYAQRLAEAGVEVAVREYDGMLHGFLGCAGVVDAAWQAVDDAGAAVARALRR